MFLQANRRRARTAAVGAVAAAALLAGCSGGGGSGASDETLVVYTGQSGDYQANFNPYSPSRLDGDGTIFEPLFFYNLTKNEEPTPRLGTEYAWNEDGTELSITLRSDVTWGDGEKFTADDVVFTLDMITKHPTMNGTGYKGKATAVDDTHVRITFDKPSFMEAPQVLGRVWIVPEHIWGKIDDPSKDVMKKPVGTGPFALDTFKAQAFTLKANADYWGGEPDVKKIRYLSLSGNQAGADALAAGKIDWQTGPVPDMQNVEKNYPGYKAITVPMNQTVLMTCAATDKGCKGPQTDPAVRKAIHHALDRTQINKLAFQGTSSPISPGFALPERDKALISGDLEQQLAPMEPDTAQATAVLEDAGYRKNGEGIYAKDGKPVELTIKVVTGWTDYITAVDTMGQQLEKAGIKVTAQQLSWNEWSDARGQGEYELLIDSLYQGPSADPYYLYNYFFSSATTAKVGEAANPNYSRWSSEKVDRALDELKGIDREDTAERQKRFDTIQTAIEKGMPYIPVLTGGTTSEYNAEKFTGWPTEDNMYAFPAVWSRPDHSQIFMNLKPAK
ncbi:ABC transporter substrate-binding protein [Streptomyces sp. WAC 00631]|uniref:ABC transporter substrate-binding protein n=1 Tax=unclassified Streptomyces TaxID=2593676 RepID=UPI000F7785EE|nr:MULTISPECIES: ABC transporter substrate-binding protein [unclassified Streptomyces]MCC5032114.1 ABC transporter substrate-binding protein [Streptomyces sp. WAC 00631]MCC9740216.1 ABC transporter substrate-binding protein [Streptomyces sp. MNU89]